MLTHLSHALDSWIVCISNVSVTREANVYLRHAMNFERYRIDRRTLFSSHRTLHTFLQWHFSCHLIGHKAIRVECMMENHAFRSCASATWVNCLLVAAQQLKFENARAGKRNWQWEYRICFSRCARFFVFCAFERWAVQCLSDTQYLALQRVLMHGNSPKTYERHTRNIAGTTTMETAKVFFVWIFP